MCEPVDIRAQFPGGAPRAVEDIKARYYSVARQLLTGRDGGAEGVGNQAIIKHPYNPEHERCAWPGVRRRFHASSRASAFRATT